jgi:hypothetical protein
MVSCCHHDKMLEIHAPENVKKYLPHGRLVTSKNHEQETISANLMKKTKKLNPNAKKTRS